MPVPQGTSRGASSKRPNPGASNMPIHRTAGPGGSAQSANAARNRAACGRTGQAAGRDRDPATRRPARRRSAKGDRPPDAAGTSDRCYPAGGRVGCQHYSGHARETALPGSSLPRQRRCNPAGERTQAGSLVREYRPHLRRPRSHLHRSEPATTCAKRCVIPRASARAGTRRPAPLCKARRRWLRAPSSPIRKSGAVRPAPSCLERAQTMMGAGLG